MFQIVFSGLLVSNDHRPSSEPAEALLERSCSFN